MQFTQNQSMTKSNNWDLYKDAADRGFKAGDLNSAIDNYQAAMMEAEYFKPEDPRLTVAHDGLARCYAKQGKFPEAEASYQQSLSTKKRIFGDVSPEVLNTLMKLVGLYHKQKRYDDALAMAAQVLGIGRQVMGQNNIHMASISHGIAKLFLLTGRSQEAEDLFRLSASILANNPDKKYLYQGEIFHDYAAMLRSMGRDAEADHLLTFVQ